MLECLVETLTFVADDCNICKGGEFSRGCEGVDKGVELVEEAYPFDDDDDYEGFDQDGVDIDLDEAYQNLDDDGWLTEDDDI